VGDEFPRPQDTLPGKHDATRALIVPCRSELTLGEAPGESEQMSEAVCGTLW